MPKTNKIRNVRRAEAERLQRRYDTFLTFIALLVLTVAPVFFRMVKLDFVGPTITNTTSADTSTMSDVFTHYKTLMYYALSAVLTAVFAVRLLTTEYSDFRLTGYDAALAALCAFLVLSCILSDYRFIATDGFIYMLDGTFVHVAYCVLFFFGFHVFSKSRLRKWFFIPFFVCGLVNALISLLNFSGVKMIDTAIIKTILGVPAKAVATDAKAFTSTFGNVNYLSGFGGVLFAIFFARLMFSSPAIKPAARGLSGGSGKPVARKNAPKKTTPAPGTGFLSEASRFFSGRVSTPNLIQNAFSFIMIAAAFTMIITSMASSGFFTIVVMIPVILVFSALLGITARKIALAASALAMCALIFLPLSAMNETVFEESFGMFKQFVSDAADSRQDVERGGGVMLTADENVGGWPNYDVNALADDGFIELAFNPEAELLHEGETEPHAIYDGVPVMNLALSGVKPTGILALSGGASDTVASGGEIVPPELNGFNLPSYFPSPAVAPGTGRLYIWKETFRLIAKKPLTGYGMDTLSYAFPQNDLYKVAGLGSHSVFVTKPHNAYISYAYGAGIPALLAFLLLNIFGAIAFIRYFLSVKTARIKPDKLIICAFMGWAAYLVQAFVNDDLISTAPLFWALFGIGAGMVHAAAGDIKTDSDKKADSDKKRSDSDKNRFKSDKTQSETV